MLTVSSMRVNQDQTSSNTVPMPRVQIRMRVHIGGGCSSTPWEA